MTRFINPSLSTEHSGVARADSVATAARGFTQNFDSSRGLAAVLLAAVVSALVVAADQLVDSWADGHLLMAWMVVWAVGFAAMALFAGSARNLASRVVKALDAWSLREARARADKRLWATALSDPRIMADLQVAMGRAEQAEVAATAVAERPQSNRIGRAMLRAFDLLDAQAYSAANYRVSSHI
ncbi:MAG: hypothetical protein ABIP34_13020 [Rhodoferax sp.]|uniref:hypothetical protein n=1 Tax=Rhodoferax sp. TaxID=50421 RepID=UPI00326575BF